MQEQYFFLSYGDNRYEIIKFWDYSNDYTGYIIYLKDGSYERVVKLKNRDDEEFKDWIHNGLLGKYVYSKKRIIKEVFLNREN